MLNLKQMGSLWVGSRKHKTAAPAKASRLLLRLQVMRQAGQVREVPCWAERQQTRAGWYSQKTLRLGAACNCVSSRGPLTGLEGSREEGSGWCNLHVPERDTGLQAAAFSAAGRQNASCPQVSAAPHLQVQMHNIVAVQIDEAADHVQQQGGTCRHVTPVSCQSAGVLALNDDLLDPSADLQGDTA